VEDDADGDGPTVDPSRFTSEGAWTSAPADWRNDPEASLESEEALRIVREAIDRLPERQRIVITLRDLEGLSSNEVRNVLDVSETNQRVLLHRARAKVRQALEDWIAS
jgi:RNA polymerase sigma-70 factor (ECF subfamily)